MKAVGHRANLPISDPTALIDFDAPKPTAGARDVLVNIAAVAVNPVDYKVRTKFPVPAGETRILGWDACGTVEAVGPNARRFKPGDQVYYAGALMRPGSNAEYQTIDERIVGHKPKSLTIAEAAALPLTTITAWELLFDRLGVARSGGKGQSLLVVGGAGGVGSILIQLAKQLTALTIIATASRPETNEWCRTLGAHHVIDHAKPLGEQLKGTGTPLVDHIAALTETETHFPALAKALKPQGRIAVIDDPKAIDVNLLKRKSASLHWEFMFTRSMFETPDIDAQGALLDEVATLVDGGRLRTTLGEHYGAINAANLKRAHAFLESGKAKGKVVLEGF
ncbi:MAG: zinc-binding alcohol dehydrogenase family protein [Alphaproteobacteria bacterium]|nr:zinc-binding alcohol dehydrogenase family protein [Alphaproteobacteria bacterium]